MDLQSDDLQRKYVIEGISAPEWTEMNDQELFVCYAILDDGKIDRKNPIEGKRGLFSAVND